MHNVYWVIWILNKLSLTCIIIWSKVIGKGNVLSLSISVNDFTSNANIELCFFL